MNAKAATAEVLPPQVLMPQVPMIPTTDADRMLAAAVDKGLSLDHIERLLAMRKELRAEAAKAAFLDAMARFQAECPVINKNRTAQIRSKSGAQFSYKYAELGAIVKVAAPIAGKHGLSYTIKCELEREPVPAQVATVHVSHILGHSESSTFRAPIDLTAVVNDMQKAASAQTFAKRIAFCNALGILTHSDDDDGRGGGFRDDGDTGSGEPQQRQQRPAGPQRKAQPDDGTPATDSQKRMVKAKLEHAALSTADMKKKFGFEPDAMTKAKVNDVLDWIRNPTGA